MAASVETRRLGTGWMILALAILLTSVATLSLAGWLMSSEAGFAWAVERLERSSDGRLRVAGASGRLAGPMTVRRIDLDLPDAHYRIDDLHLDWWPLALLRGRLHLDSLSASRVERRAIESATAAAPPDEFRLPLPLQVDRLRIDALFLIDSASATDLPTAARAAGHTADEKPPPQIRALQAAISSDGRHHQLSDFSLTIDAGTIEGFASIDGEAPHGLIADARFDGRDPALSANASVTGTIAEMRVEFGATMQGNTAVSHPPAATSPPAMSLAGSATLRPFAVQALAAIDLSVQGFDPQSLSSEAPQGRLSLSANLRARDDGWLTGRLRVDNAAPATIDHGGLPFTRLESEVLLSTVAAPWQLRLESLRLAAGVPSGVAATAENRVSGRIDLTWPTTVADHEKSAALPRVDADLEVARLDPAALHSALQSMSLDGRLTLAGDVSGQQATVDVGDGARRLAVRLAHREGRLTLSALRLAQGEAELSGSGEIRFDAPRAWRFAGQLRNFDPQAFIAPGDGVEALQARLNARFTADGRLMPRLGGRLRFTIANSRLAGEALAGSGDLRFVGIDQFATLLAGTGDAWVRGTLDLRLGVSQVQAAGGWGSPAERLTFTLSAPDLSSHQRLFPGLGGRVSLSGHLAGLPTNPQAALQLKAHELALPGGQRLGTLNLDGELTGDSLALTVAAAGLGDADASLIDSLQLALAGSIAANQTQATVRLSGGEELAIALNGGFSASPAALLTRQAIDWRGTIDSLSWSGQFPFSLREAAAMSVTRGDEGWRASIDEAQVAIAGGELVIAEGRWDAGQWSTRGHFASLALRQGDAPPDMNEVLRLGGEWSLAGKLADGNASGVDWLAQMLASLEGTLNVQRESGDWLLPGILPVELRRAGLSAAGLNARVAGGRVEAEMRVSGSRVGRWRAEATLPLGRGGHLVAPDAPLDGWLQAAVDDLQWLAPAINGNFSSGGSLALDARISGTLDDPAVDGYLRGNALSFGLIDEGVLLRDGELRVRFDRQTATVERMVFAAPHAPPVRAAQTAGFALPAPPGAIEVTGDFDFAAQRGALRATLSRVPLSQRPERWLVVSGNARLDYAEDRLVAGAELAAVAGFIAEASDGGRPTLADDIVVLGDEEERRRALPTETEIGIDLGEHFHLRAAGLSARLGGRLRVRGRPGDSRLTATGTIIARDATFEAYGQRLVVERGIVNFQGPLEDPGLNVLALRKGGEVEAGIAVSGTVQRPVVRLVSTPEVPDAEKLSWIVLGRPPSAGGVDTSLLVAAAESILGGDGEGVATRLAQRLGVDEVSLRSDGDGEQLANQVLVLGKRVSARTHLGYEQSLTAATRAIRLTHTLTPRISLVTRAGDDTAIDVFYNLSFD